MSAAKRGADQSSSGGRLNRARSLLIEALELIDMDDQPEVGARLQGIIDSIEGRLKRLKRGA